MTTTTHAQTQIKRHPIRGGLYGLLLGIGVAVYVVIFALTPFSVSTSVIVLAIFVALGIAWGTFAPARQPDTVPPAGTSLGSTFARSGNEDVASPSYEATFASGSAREDPQTEQDPEA